MMQLHPHLRVHRKHVRWPRRVPGLPWGGPFALDMGVRYVASVVAAGIEAETAAEAETGAGAGLGLDLRPV
jgi:hypothetical protein